MEATSACRLDPRTLYEATMSGRTRSQQEVDGQNAVRLIEAATAVATGGGASGNRPLPEGATISIRV